MKLVILAGGFGTRLSELTGAMPKPLVEVGGKPIIWHIIKHFQQFGINEFVVCLGYKGEMLKKYFLDYSLLNSDLLINNSNSSVTILKRNDCDNFEVSLIETGEGTNTAGRIKQIQKYVENERFFLTYGDGISNINIHDLLRFHLHQSKIATVSCVQLKNRFGEIALNDTNIVESFEEKRDNTAWTNIGYFVLEPEIFNYLKGEVNNIQWEKGPLVEICKDGELSAYKHLGFWKCMDSLRDKVELDEELNRNPSWKSW